MANGYALGQLAHAFVTATTHEDAIARRRADRRAGRWAQALQQMADGDVLLGSRTPVRGLPAWVTLEVLRGGFATGSAVAETALQADEVTLASRRGTPRQRRMIFGYFLTDAGLEELNELLDSGGYRVEFPEDAALLTVAALLRAGDREGAMDILDAISPLADRLRFAPKRASAPTSRPDFVFRITAGDAVQVLRSRTPNPRVEAQREALSVWSPFSDRVLTLWLERYADGQIATVEDPDWRRQAAALVDEYDRLAAVHTSSSKHKKPKENLAILVRAMRTAAAGGRLENREAGLVACAIRDCLVKRGLPGSTAHATLRDQQRTVATTPAHWQLAAVAAERLDNFSQADGIEDPASLTGRVTTAESEASGLPEGAEMPRIVPRVLTRAHAAPVEELVAEGVVPSAEVLAELVPRISATVVAAGFSDPVMARLAGANYRAFRERRSLLLLDLQKQVQPAELPWVRALERHSSETVDEASRVLHRVGTLTLDQFPATILPNPLVQEFQHLLEAAGHDVALVEELAADIFMGRFSDKFRRAAQNATSVISDTIYARYYDIDVGRVSDLVRPPKPDKGRGWSWWRPQPPEPGNTFANLCAERAGRQPDDRWSVAANGTVIEQSQILTTHNLAALVSLGIRPSRPWADLARESFAQTASLLELASRQPRPLATVKDAAYAWRQGIFYLSLADSAEATALLDDDSVAPQPAVMAELRAGLRRAKSGEQAESDDHAPFLGWSVGRHWMLDALGHAAPPKSGPA